MNGVRSRDLAADLTADEFVAAIESAETYRLSSFWLRLILGQTGLSNALSDVASISVVAARSSVVAEVCGGRSVINTVRSLLVRIGGWRGGLSQCAVF